ncbi:DNA repair protein XRCC2 [Biomphalaria pfeifferi]|uniref:DNA repair protein XRCC2 n=1 Tax=Biomphalaria pfeifferi TaxID=112525 RepID=A0AAD8EZT2_BIOPF|nr:DNA repair protein XRCC2 [Biomphalaria pfeifferi]
MQRKGSKAESGSQLLARLISRTDLTCVDPYVFCHVGPPFEVPSKQGKIIELYGTEGVGKTELALLYTAKICLPSEWKGHHLDGRGAKVVFVDTEFKFSVLHLAIIMEQIILKYINRESSLTITKDNEKVGQTPESYNIPNQDDLSSKELFKPSQSSPFCINNGTMSGHTSESKKMNSESNSKISIKNNLVNPTDQNLLGKNVKQEIESSSNAYTKNPLTEEDVETIVLDSLGRLQVFRVSSTRELTATLISLNTMMSGDPLLSLIVVDTISAYYWIDKTLSTDSSHCTESCMSPISNIIAKQVAEFGVTYLTIKSALIGQKRAWVNDVEHARKNCDSSKAESALTDHVEFLGRSWSKLPLRRIVLTQNIANGKKKVIASCSEWPNDRVFSFLDDLLQME